MYFLVRFMNLDSIYFAVLSAIFYLPLLSYSKEPLMRLFTACVTQLGHNMVWNRANIDYTIDVFWCTFLKTWWRLSILFPNCCVTKVLLHLWSILTPWTPCTPPIIVTSCELTHRPDDPFTNVPDSKVHGAYMGPTWGRQDPCGPMLTPWTLLSGVF